MIFVYRSQTFAHSTGRVADNNFSVFHNGDFVGNGENIFKAVFGDYNGKPEFAVEFFEHRDKFRCGYRVKLSRRFVKQ